MVKDHRTKESIGDVNRVLDGDLDGLIKSYLMKRSSGTLGEPTPDDDVD
jgi:peptide chain release factor 2